MITSDVNKLTSAILDYFIHFHDNMVNKVLIETGYFQGDNRLITHYIYVTAQPSRTES